MGFPTTSLTTLIGIDVPIVSAPIGGISTPALVAAVSNAGGLGMLSGTWRSERGLRRLLDETSSRTDRPFGVNFVLEFDVADKIDICLQAGVRVISLFWGDAAPWAARVHDAGSLLCHTVGSAHDARIADAAGVDILVAQGMEAGGHVEGRVSTLALVPAVADAAPTRPVIAAGGIADGRGLAAVLCLGASGAWMGTRFVASIEANAHPEYQELLLAADETATTHEARLFNVGWDNAPHRVLKNSTYDAWVAAGRPEPGNRPGEGEHIGTLTNGTPVLRYSDDAPTQQVASGDPEMFCLYAGQSVGLITTVKSAGDIVRDVVSEARSVLGQAGA
jgi:nitronate monooxygenase